MKLKVNQMYQTDAGYIVPRSHFKDEKGVKWCVVQVLEQHETTFRTHHTTMTQKDIKDALGLGKNERVEIV